MTPWQQCYWCNKIVKVNKPIFGSMHICLTEEEKAMKSRPMPPQQIGSGASSLLKAINEARLPVKKGVK